MKKGYWVVAYRSISDESALKAYGALAVPACQSFGGSFLTMSTSRVEAHEAGLQQRTIVVQFDSYDIALAAQADFQPRMKALEDSLIATPATSLALPLLRKDLDTLRERMQANELDSKQREQQSTDTMKWIFGLVAALITGVVAQWFGSRFKKTWSLPPPGVSEWVSFASSLEGL